MATGLRAARHPLRPGRDRGGDHPPAIDRRARRVVALTVSEVPGLVYEQEQWIITAQRIEKILLEGFTGEIRLQCLQGVVMKLVEVKSHNLEAERRQQGVLTPRRGKDRRKEP